MKTDRIKTLVDKYYEGQTTEEEEIELRGLLKEQSTPQEFLSEKELFSLFDAFAEDPGENTIFDPARTRTGVNAPQKRAAVREIKLSWFSGIAASLALLVVGVSIGLLINHQGMDTDQVAAIRSDLQEMKEMVALDKLKDASASERILAAYQVKQMGEADNAVLDALINSLTADDNVNVRMAAADALYKFGDNDKVRRAFVKALSLEKNPNLEIKLIDMLVGLQEKSALPTLQKVMENDTNLEVVRQRAAQGMGKLI